MVEFLSVEKIDKLNRMFQYKPVGGKYYIPIGLQKLKLHSVEKKETKRKGMWMYVVEFKKDPEETEFRATKASFKPIKCYHILTGNNEGNFNKLWYKPFTTTLREEPFLKLKQFEKQYFQAVIKQREKVVEVDDRLGGGKRDIMAVDIEIMDVYPLNKTNIEIDYLSLYEECEQSEALLSQAQN
jgi:hypothetical protein